VLIWTFFSANMYISGANMDIFKC